jgi:sporulation protein YlmC with PRC-barrel domain
MQSEVDAETLIGLDVVNADGETIGEIDNVVIDANGEVRHVIVGVGGFLGIGEKDVAIAWDKLTVAADHASVSVPYTKDQLTALPSHTLPDDVERGTAYDYDRDVSTNSYLSQADAATADAVKDVGESTAQAAAEAADETSSGAAEQDQATVTMNAARVEASDLLGADVRTAGGEDVGDVDEIWIDANGKVAGVVVDVGGYLGIGSDPVLLAWEDLQVRQEGDDVTAVTPLTREQIEGLTSTQNSSN